MGAAAWAGRLPGRYAAFVSGDFVHPATRALSGLWTQWHESVRNRLSGASEIRTLGPTNLAKLSRL